MTRHIAFLRAINVGGHVVTMATLKGHFEALGLRQVETFIASGNVIFATTARSAPTLERKIEARLLKSLGYEVRTFLRTDAEVAAIARYRPFTDAQFRKATAFCVGFMAEPLGAEAHKAVLALRTATEDLHLNGREVYWLSQHKQSDSTFSGSVFEKVTKARITFRNLNTVERLTAKYPPSGGGA